MIQFMKYYLNMREFLISLPRNFKRSVMILADIIVIYIVLWISLMIRSGDLFWPNEKYTLTNAQPEIFLITGSILVLVTIPVFVYMRLYARGSFRKIRNSFSIRVKSQ